MLIRLLLFESIIIYTVTSYPSVIIKEGGHGDEEQHKHHKEDNHDVKIKLGSSNFNAENGFKKDNENKYAQGHDTGKYAEKNLDKKHHLEQTDFNDKKYQNQEGGTVSDSGNQSSHKKGHHKTGFHNTYHKDESGTNSSYFDDSNNEGGEYNHKSHKGTFGDSSSHDNRGLHLDNNYKLKENDKHGEYDRGGGYNKDVGDHRNYNNENYHHNRENQDKTNAGANFGSAGGYQQEQYRYRDPQPHYFDHPYHYNSRYQNYERPDYYPKHNYYNIYPEPHGDYNYPEKRTITIYEDPRYYEESSQHKRYESYPYKSKSSDAVKLDIRPPFRKHIAPFYGQIKPVYEHSYY